MRKASTMATGVFFFHSFIFQCAQTHFKENKNKNNDKHSNEIIPVIQNKSEVENKNRIEVN
jgi:hypothetical protein